MVVALLILCLHLGAVDGSRVSPRIEQQRIEKLMQELSEMEVSVCVGGKRVWGVIFVEPSDNGVFEPLER